ncbi:hydroxylase [Acrocarpospora pleiomorpha]|uniref:Hydroxylase n=1 Tax=Acrocarpospora pleiomorpha TaxID=90975 RepID=A0A5M3Y1E8_9ACTN|nr:VOC family protein [Acrocarpospora pleiomorpha]GES24538.1 hydroxylase [Acrocarpospora pleiomorpha]
MPEFTRYRPGTACWVDLSSTNVEESEDFYGQLFGWTAEFDDRPETGGYGMFRRGGKAVAGIGRTMSENQPTSWNTYFATEDAGKTAQAVREAGGTVIMEPMEIVDEGTMAVFQDPTGAYVSVWQSNRHPGAQVAGEPGTLNWVELLTRDVEAAKNFYTQVFGWTADNRMMGSTPYTMFMMAGETVCGMMEMGSQFPAEVPAHWLVYLGTADLDATIAQARGLGARQLYGPMTVPDMGRFAVFADPQRATFAAWQQA